MSAAAPQDDPLDGHQIVARWSFQMDMDFAISSGEFLLRSDGTLLRRSASSVFQDDLMTWEFGQWEPLWGWVPASDAESAFVALRARGYELGVGYQGPIESSVAGPFPGWPELFRPL